MNKICSSSGVRRSTTERTNQTICIAKLCNSLKLPPLMVLLILLLLLCCSWNDKVRCELEFNYDISSCNLYSRDYMRITHVNDKEEDQDDEEEEEEH